jgi:hypothetical protein
MEFRVASTIGLNGFIHDVVYFFEERSYNRVPSGMFAGSCIVTKSPADLLCTYAISLFNTQGPHGVGGIIAHGPVTGDQNVAIVTAVEYDLKEYKRGSMVTEHHTKLPILYTKLILYG